MITDPHQLAGAVKKLGKEVGFDLVGITSSEPLVQAGQRLRQAIRSGHTANMHYLQRDPGQRSQPQALFPWAKGIISVGLNYHSLPPAPPQSHHLVRLSHNASPNSAPSSPTKDGQSPPPSRTPNPHPGVAGLISRYALGQDYHQVLTEKLRLFRDRLFKTIGQDFRNRLAVDTLAIMEKPLAQRAGIGWQGKNSLIINSKYGSWIFLGELITDLELAPDSPAENQCGNCRACIDACPTGALSEPGILDARKCLSYLTIELKGNFIPKIVEIIKIQKQTSPCLYGCDVCQNVCPFNRDTPQTKEQQFWPRDEILNLNVEQLVNLTEPQFLKLFADTPLARLSYQQFQRNVLVRG